MSITQTTTKSMVVSNPPFEPEAPPLYYMLPEWDCVLAIYELESATKLLKPRTSKPGSRMWDGPPGYMQANSEWLEMRW
ncbi:hypothetical protein TWF106_003813 [Orbilia oligospora]|uniref:Uncharacterized protein n=1 Tax=Orbilia oligospora TaxID=2813651 RepID=A0A6G1MC44_ORBOL|nr:hypothetical protein TWF788_009146 [Orbilia oligospora]KAF3199444.1 hypothetical protein TWF106_003813 [Orbilia oligospora]KAF3202422.1 hypothetical protein TWF679_010817 [Orbilia oligospora]KAF3205231.1 hypothetical protein TWF191_001939 [Orbilia oligospora]KAF3251004.1 hypothetical protein TWF192_004983 [Orbilia oligospora]